MRIDATSVTGTKIEPVTQKAKLPPKEVWQASAAHFSTDFYNGFFSPLLPIIVTKMDISLVMAGSLVAILSIFNSLLQPVTGLLADKLHKNYFVVFGSLLTALFMSLIGVVDQYYMLAILLALSGIGTSLFHPQGAALVGRIPSSRPGFSMSIFNVGGSFGFAVGPLVVVPLVLKWGLHSTVYSFFLAVILLFFTFPVLKKWPNAAHREKPELLKSLKGYGSMVFLLFFMVVIRASLTILFQSFTPMYLTTAGNSLFLGAMAVTVFQIFGTAGLLVGGYFMDRMNPITLLKISFLMTFPFILIFIFLPSAWGLPFYGIAAFFLFSSTPVNILMGQSLLPKNASFISGVMMGFGWGLGGMLATPFGALADHTSLFTALFIVSLLAIPGFILALLCPGSLKHAGRKF